MSAREFAVELHKQSNVDRGIIRRVGLLVVSGWIGGFSWHLAQTRLTQLEKVVLSVVLFVIGVILVASIEYAAAVGDAVAKRQEKVD